ncbi:hypothetical protein BsWGS_11237 [Bradybaena similaris]
MMNWCGLPSRQMHHKSDSIAQPVVKDTQNSQDSAFSSHMMSSQMTSSQCSDFSQIASQDMFSQNNIGPQVENNSQQGIKKMSMYEKWLSKRSLFRRDPTPSAAAENKTNQHIVTAQPLPPDNISKHSCYGTSDNTLTRPLIDSNLKGTERDLLRQVTYAIHDCSTEMKSALCAVTDKLDNVTEMTNDQLAQTLTSFLEDIWKHQEKLQHVLQDQDKSKSVVTELEVKLAKKESQIAALEEQLAQTRKDRTPRFAKAVRCEMQSPQLLLQRKLEEILEWTKDTREQQNQHLNKYLQSMDTHCKQHVNKGHSHEAEKRMLAELRKVPDKLECKQRELHAQLTEDIKSCLLVYKADFEDMMRHFIQQYCNQLICGAGENTVLHRASFLDLFKVQVEAVSGTLCDAINNHFIKNNQQLAQLQDTLTQSTQQIKAMVQAGRVDTESIACIGHRLDGFQASLKQHLISIQNKHSGELKELRNQICKQLNYPAENSVVEHSQSVSVVEPSIMKEISPDFAKPDPSSAMKGNNSLVATACSHVNATMLKLSRNASENTITRGCVMDKNSLGSSSQIYEHSSQSCQMNLSAFTNSNVQAYSTVPGDHQQKTPSRAAQAAAPGNLHPACCHPFAQCEVSFTLKSGPSPVIAENPDNCQNNYRRNIPPKQNMIRMKVDSSNLKKQVERKRDVSMKKKNMTNMHPENITNMTDQEEKSMPIGTWTRSRYKYFQNIQTVPKHNQPVGWPVGSSGKLVNDHKHSQPSKQDKTTKQYSDKRDPSVYDFHDETCQPPATLWNRKRVSTDSLENISLASFINNGSADKRKDSTLEKNSECSSPTVSISKMSIVRKVKTPFRRPFRIDALNKASFDTHSPAPTLLTDICCKM